MPSSHSFQSQMMTFTTVDGLSYTPTDEQKDRDLAKVKATGRRMWKTLKGKPEAVWSPELEHFLIEALEQYSLSDDNKPQVSKTGLRFPRRNRFISDYVYDKTQKRRTHKQVGSRLQQLRDTGDRRVCSLIGHGVFVRTHREGRATGNTEQTSPPAPKSRKPGTADVSVYVQLVVDSTSHPSTTPKLQIVGNDFDSPVAMQLRALRPASPATLATSSNSTHISCRWALDLKTTFIIYREKKMVHQEQGVLTLVSRPSKVSNNWTYECDIGGAFWGMISGHENPNQLTILQFLTPIAGDARKGVNYAAARKVSIIYHFAVESVSEGPSYPVLSVATEALSVSSWYPPPPTVLEGYYALETPVAQPDHICVPNCSHHRL